jgi:hypothetical protein
MLKFALFFDMMKHWNDGGGVEKAMNFRRRDATRNTNRAHYASLSTTLLYKVAQPGGHERTGMDTPTPKMDLRPKSNAMLMGAKMPPCQPPAHSPS